MAYRTADRPTGTCPGCERNLKPWGTRTERYEMCPRCDGVFVDEPTLDALCDVMRLGAAMLPLATLAPGAGTEKARRCPVCRDAMAKVYPRGAADESPLLDRCGLHGLWFDKNELELVLKQVAQQPPVPQVRANDVPDLREEGFLHQALRALFSLRAR